MGLVVDVGHLYAQRRFMQNAADAGALAGARSLALNEALPDAQRAVHDYTVGYNAVGSVISDVQGSTVAVTVTREVPTYFMGIMGIEANTVAASAEAGHCPIGKISGMMPFGVQDGNIMYGVESMVWDNIDGDPTQDKDYPKDWVNAGNNLITSPHRGWINLDPDHSSGNASDTKLWLGPAGFPGVIDLSGGGIWLTGTTGTMASCLGALKDWVDRLDPEDPRRKVLVPVYTEYVQQNKNKAQFFITGFAVMHVIEVQKTTNFKYIKGRFEPWAIVQPGGQCGGEDYGARIVRLER